MDKSLKQQREAIKETQSSERRNGQESSKRTSGLEESEYLNGYRQNTVSSDLSDVIQEEEEEDSPRIENNGHAPLKEVIPSETDNAIVTAQALTELIEERLQSIRGRNDVLKARRVPDVKGPTERPSSGRKVNVSELVSPPLSAQKDRDPVGRNGRPLSGSLHRPSSGNNSRPSSTANDGARATLNSREARLQAQNKSRVYEAFANNSRPPSGLRRQDTLTPIPHTGPRPCFKSFYAVSDTVARIRKWSQVKYRARRLEYKKTPDSKSRNKSSDSKRSRHSNKRQREMADASRMTKEEKEALANRRRTRTFAWYARVIKAVVKLSLDMRKLSMQKTEQTPISEMYYINISGPSTGEDPTQQLFFDKSWFSRKRATSRVPLWAQALTIKHPDKRSEEDVLRLHTLLLNMRSFKEKFTEDMRLKMCKVIRYTQCDKGRVILRQGHYGQDFYFIYSGSVFIQIDIEDPTTGTVTAMTENIIRNGESFGEIALMGDGERSACVICREPTELFQIDKSTFMEVCPGIFKVELADKVEFAKKFPIFKDWDEEKFESLCFNSQVLYVPHGRIIEQDWSKSNYVYFVMKGRISLLKKFDVRDMYDLTAKGMMDKELHFRRPENEENVETRTRQACVGAIRENEQSELRILSLEPPSNIVSLTLLSEGVKVLRVAVRTFKRQCPRRLVEDYLKKDFVPVEIPSNAEICDKVFRDSIWTSYKRSVMRTVELEQSGFAIAHLPATIKGTSGWARWPGFDDDAEEKTSRLTQKSARSYVDPFLIVRTPVRKTRQEVRLKTRDRNQNEAGTRPDVLVETDEEHGILPIIVNNDHSFLCKPRGVANALELRRNVSRFMRGDDISERLQTPSVASGKSIFITETQKE